LFFSLRRRRLAGEIAGSQHHQNCRLDLQSPDDPITRWPDFLGVSTVKEKQ